MRPRREGTGAEVATSSFRIPVRFSLNMGPSGPEHMERDFGISPKSLRGNDIGSLSPHAGVLADLGTFPDTPTVPESHHC